MTEIVDQRVDIPHHDLLLIWQLACALLPVHEYNFQAAFAAAIRKRNALINVALTDGVDVGPGVTLRKDSGGGWYLDQKQ